MKSIAKASLAISLARPEKISISRVVESVCFWIG